jgi:hypothetical protein
MLITEYLIEGLSRRLRISNVILESPLKTHPLIQPIRVFSLITVSIIKDYIMPDGATITIEGMDELIAKLEKLGKLSTVHAALKAGGTHIKGLMTVYPPETMANNPGNPSGQWYDRGWGVRYKGGGGRQTSEVLDSKWTLKYDKSKFEAVVGNNASYARFVQGVKGEQAKHMAGIGWKSIDTVAEEETKRVAEFVFDAVRRAIGV